MTLEKLIERAEAAGLLPVHTEFVLKSIREAYWTGIREALETEKKDARHCRSDLVQY